MAVTCRKLTSSVLRELNDTVEPEGLELPSSCISGLALGGFSGASSLDGLTDDLPLR